MNRRPSLSSGRPGHVPMAMASLLLACAMVQAPRAEAAGPGKRPAEGNVTIPHAAPILGSEAVLRAVALVGVPYRWGGSEPSTGLDCSGLVHHVFGQIGLATPRDTHGLSRTGATVPRKGLQPGDLVFFNTLRRAYSHVGIYLGNGRFVHAPSAGSSVRIESMNTSYWRQRYNGARRLGPVDDLAPTPATRLASSGDEDRGSGASDATPSTTRVSVARAGSTESFYRY
ncbi:MAG: C40 family peptidase [Pseudomonadota bacterium]|nr:C40 family peptidase [Pseudomonadota bacterium]